MLDSLTLPSGDAEAGDIEATPCCPMYARASWNSLRIRVIHSGADFCCGGPARTRLLLRAECYDNEGVQGWAHPLHSITATVWAD